jgi:uncharacterized membrane protein
MSTLITYAIATVTFFAIDMVWLGLVAKNFYRTKLSHVLSPDVVWPAAIVFYLIYIAGIVYFAINPALKDASWQDALLKGALLGGLCYATYDLTNMATIAKWPIEIVIVDIIWGVVLTGSVSLITFLIANAIK